MTLALQGIKVVEVAQTAAAPMAGRLLADLGADVIHERRGHISGSINHLINSPSGIYARFRLPHTNIERRQIES